MDIGAGHRHFRSWLQAEDPRIEIFVGFTFSCGHSDAEFPLLDALRTHGDGLWTAAYDPKETIKTGLRKPNRRLR